MDSRLAVASLLLISTPLLAPAPAYAAASPHTSWSVSTSQGFDALCALNLLSGDRYYLDLYPAEEREFAQPRYAAARRAAALVKAELKDRNGEIVSAFLTLLFSGGPDSTLASVLASAREPARLLTSFRASPYWSQESWDLFLRVRPLVVQALAAMHDAGFEADWMRHMGSGGGARSESLRAQLEGYDVLGEQERLLGHPLQGGRIDVVLLWYSMPHGIRIQGSRYLTNIDYPLTIVLRNAAHEPLHPPYDRNTPDMARALATLSGDSLIARIVRTHDPSLGYTTAAGYIEEDAVQALEQVVSDRLGFASPPDERWRLADDGMHLLAAAIYDLMKESGFAASGGCFERWFAGEVASGRLSGTEIERRARAVVKNDAVK